MLSSSFPQSESSADLLSGNSFNGSVTASDVEDLECPSDDNLGMANTYRPPNKKKVAKTNRKNNLNNSIPNDTDLISPQNSLAQVVSYSYQAANEVAEELPSSPDVQPWKIIFKYNLMGMAISYGGTALWEAVFYTPPQWLGGETPAYFIKLSAMSILPNLFGAKLTYFAEKMRLYYLRNQAEIERVARVLMKEYLKTYLIVDAYYQVQQDCIHSTYTQKWEGFAETLFGLQVFLLNLLFTGLGLSLVHYLVTRKVCEPEHVSWKLSALVGPTYFLFYGSDYPLDKIGESLGLSDEVSDFGGAPILTGLGTFAVYFLYDVFERQHALYMRFLLDKIKLEEAANPNMSDERRTELRKQLINKSCHDKLKSYTFNFFKINNAKPIANEKTKLLTANNNVENEAVVSSGCMETLKKSFNKLFKSKQPQLTQTDENELSSGLNRTRIKVVTLPF